MQFLKQARISGRKIAGVQFRGRNPLEREAAERLRLVLRAATAIELQADGFFRVLVSEALDQFANDDFDPQLFPQFARQTLFEGFVRFTFAAGKFPKSAKVDVHMTLGDEQLAAAKNQAGSNVDGGHERRNRPD